MHSDNESLHEELLTYKNYQMKADRRLEEMQTTILSLNADIMEMKD